MADTETGSVERMVRGGVWDDSGEGDPLSDPHRLDEPDRARLRAVLGFPETVESGAEAERPGRLGRVERQHSEPADVAPATDDDVARRLDQLGQRVETLSGLIEDRFDRVDQVSLRVETLAGLVEDRFDRVERLNSEPVVAPAIDDYVARRFDQVSERVETLTGLVEKVFDRLDSSIAGAFSSVSADDLADFAARMVRLAEERNARLPADIKEARRDLQRFDRSVVDLQAAIVSLPAQVAMPERVRQEIQRFDQPLRDLQAAIAELPERVGRQEPLDASIVELLDAKLTEMSEHLAEQMREALNARRPTGRR